jgi:hypothetical protein
MSSGQVQRPDAAAHARGVLREAYHLLPRALRLAILVKRREPLWIERGIVFIHVPKAAGTSINQALYGRFMGHARAVDIERWGSARLRALPRFAVVRNPWDRLLSAYRFARRGSGIGEQVAGMHKPAQYHVPEFGTFERFVEEWLAPRDPGRLDGVFQPQSNYVHGQAGQLLVDHLGKFEDLEPTFDYISGRIGTVGRIARTNRSGDEVDYRQFYTSRTAKLVEQIYRMDVDAFGYEF